MIKSEVHTKERDLSLEDVKEIINSFMKENFDLELDIPVEWSTRLKRRWGYFRIQYFSSDITYKGMEFKSGESLEGSLKIIINKELSTATNRDLAIKVIKHEALHYVLYKLGKPFQDGNDYFEREIERLNLVSSGVSQKDLGINLPYWVWECSECGDAIIKRKGKTRKDYSRGYASKCCSSPLKEVGWKYLN